MALVFFIYIIIINKRGVEAYTRPLLHLLLHRAPAKELFNALSCL
jgi:hypothetical protein